MIKDNKEEYLIIEGENGAELEVEEYVIEYPKSKYGYKNGKVSIDINYCERVVLSKEDALSLVEIILKIIA